MSKVSSKNKINKSIKTEEEEKEKIQVKILIIGETGVGKSNFIYRYIENKFSSNSLSSVGFGSNVKIREINGKKIIVQLWDSAGQSIYKSITKNLFNRVQGIIILYDITNLNSFLNVENWIKIIEQENKKLIYEIAGNKCDLEELRSVNINEGKNLGNKYRVNFYEVSAKNNINIIECVNDLVKKILENLDLQANPTFNIDERSFRVKEKSNNERCC
jgi:small GTP-binding protein